MGMIKRLGIIGLILVLASPVVIGQRRGSKVGVRGAMVEGFGQRGAVGSRTGSAVGGAHRLRSAATARREAWERAAYRYRYRYRSSVNYIYRVGPRVVLPLPMVSP